MLNSLLRKHEFRVKNGRKNLELVIINYFGWDLGKV